MDFIFNLMFKITKEDSIMNICDYNVYQLFKFLYCNYSYVIWIISFCVIIWWRNKIYMETRISSLGRMIQNFFELFTFTDPIRETNFPQNWTIYYWSYWMVWCVAAPFFIGRISQGRTIRQTILGGYVFGVGSTIISFIILRNYSMGMEIMGSANFISEYLANGNLYGVIVSIIETMPLAPIVLVIVLITMIAFYATSFDSIALTASCYSIKN